jgi:hypothetical protein
MWGTMRTLRLSFKCHMEVSTKCGFTRHSVCYKPVGMAWAVRSREDSRCPADRCPRTRRCKLPLESRTRTRSHAPIPPSTNTRRCTAHSAPSARAPRRTARPGTRGTASRWLGTARLCQFTEQGSNLLVSVLYGYRFMVAGTTTYQDPSD